MNKYRWQIPITLVFVFMGILLSLQYQAQSRISSDLSMQRTENLIAMVRDLSQKRQKLNLEVFELNYKLRTQTETYRDEKKIIEDINHEINELSIVNGTVPLEGSGLSVTMGENMPILYIDLINLVNELWAAGAEAIAINDQRVTYSSVIFYAEDELSMSITVNNRKLQFPIEIKALGDPNNLEKGLTIPGGIVDTLALFKAYPVLQKVDTLKVPPITSRFEYYFLQEYTPPEKLPVVAPLKQTVTGLPQDKNNSQLNNN